MQHTKNYDIFQKHPANTPINQKLVENLKDSISIKDMLRYRPIIVNEEMQVIDGQHRLEAAKSLDVPVYFLVHKASDDADMILLNATQRTWKLVDYYNYHLKKGVEEYKKLEEFITKNEMTIGEYMRLDGYGRKNNCSHLFRRGLFTMPSSEDQERNVQIWTFAKRLINFIGKRRSDIQQILKSVNFERSLVSFLKRPDVNPEELKNKLELKIDVIGARAGLGGYYQMLLEIYNFRRKDPLTP